MKINLVMIVKDEERCLERCLKAAGPLVDGIVVADTGSSDRTREIARRAGAEVLDFRWRGDFSAARNFALDHSDGDWNLVLDADEILRPCSREELLQAAGRISGQHGSSWIGALTRYDAYPGDGGAVEMSVTALPRLLPAGMRYEGIIHEQPAAGFPCVRIPLAADHDGYLYGNKGERNLSYLQRAVEQAPDDCYFRFQLGATLRNLGRLEESLPEFRIFYRECPKRSGYRTEGVLLYLYTLLDLESPVCLEEAWQVIESEEPLLGGRADYWFVCGLFYMKLVLSDTAKNLLYLPRIEASYLNCLRIGEHPEQGGVVGVGSFKAAYNLGLWYEVSGQRGKADECYRMAARWGYQPALGRISSGSLQMIDRQDMK